jgi:acyl-CoA dehydrogenase
MNFDFSDDQKLLREFARKFLKERSSTATVRHVLDGDEGYDRKLWQAIAELEWPATAIPESHGGIGYGYLELCVVAEELGRALAPVPFSSSIYLAAEAILLFGSAEQQKQYLPKLAKGQIVGTLASAEGAGPLSASAINAEVKGGKLRGTKLPVPDGQYADIAVVVAKDADSGRGQIGVFVVELAAHV